MKGRDCLSALEGPPEAVRVIAERIWDDRRHQEFRLYDMRATNHRLFPDWHLGFIDIDAEELETLEAHEGLNWLCTFAGGPASFAANGLPADRDHAG
jgi:hypothetical protein